MRAGIVGAGVAGLAAAKVLREAGHEVTIFEGKPEVGGQVVTFPVGGEPLECFYHHIFTNDTTVIRYIEELGLGPRLKWIEPKNGHFVKGRIWGLCHPPGPAQVQRYPDHEPRPSRTGGRVAPPPKGRGAEVRRNHRPQVDGTRRR